MATRATEAVPRRHRGPLAVLRALDSSVVRGIQFDEFATSYHPHAVLRDSSNGVTFENLIVTQNAMAGITETGDARR